MGYKLNRNITKEEQAATYTRSELELMSEYRLREVCRREHIVKGLDKNLTNENFQLTDESPKLILRFLRTGDSNLCEAMVRYAVSQLQISFDEYICIGVLENSYSL